MNHARPMGFPLALTPDSSGSIHWPASLEESVRHSIVAILSTRPGERLMRPELGAGLDLYLHEPNDASTRRHMTDAIVAQLGRFEPRIVIDRVDVAPSAVDDAQVDVEIFYRIRRTGAEQRASLTVGLGG